MVLARLKVLAVSCIEKPDDRQRRKLQEAVDDAIKQGVDPHSDEIRWARIVLRPDFDPDRAEAILEFYRAGVAASGKTA